MEVSISVILCTHNPRPDYLGRVLAALRGQTLPAERWEFLLVDNASEQPLAEIWDISWHSRGRHIRENDLGLTPARLRGIRESRGELLVFVDDDNVLAPNFLIQAMAISARCPVLGVFGAGILEPEFEVEPPAKLRPYLSCLALRSTQSALWSNNIKDYQSTPWGAGLCVTRRVANEYQKFAEDLGFNDVLDRRGKQLFSGGDGAFSRVAVRLGLAFHRQLPKPTAKAAARAGETPPRPQPAPKAENLPNRNPALPHRLRCALHQQSGRTGPQDDEGQNENLGLVPNPRRRSNLRTLSISAEN